jgi:tetratricopeptide (TPR) repeat protein
MLLVTLAGLLANACVPSAALAACPQTSSEIRQHFRAAREAQDRGDFDTAAAEYRNVLNLKPDFPEVCLNLGLVYYLQANFEDSIEILEKAIAMKPQIVGANLFLGIDYCKIGQFRRSTSYLEKARQQQPMSKESSFWLGTALLASGEHLKAAGVLEKAAELFPSDADILYLLGRTYQFLARDEFEVVKAQAPESAYTHRILAESYVIGEMWIPAIAHYKKLIAIAPDMQEVRVALGEVYLRQENVDEAENQFRAELSLDPFSVAARIMLAETAVYRGNVNQCLQELRQAIQANPALVPSELLLSDRPFGLERPVTSDSFRAQLTRALHELNGNQATAGDAATHFALALVNSRLGQTVECREQLRLLREDLRTSITGALDQRKSGADLKRSGMLHVLRGQYDAAILQLRDYLRSTPADRAARAALARALYESNEFLNAAKEYDRLLAEQSGDVESAYFLGKCYECLSYRWISVIVANQPDSFRSHQLLAEAFESQLQDQKALDEYRAAVAIHPSSPDLHLALARLLSKNMHVDEAIVEYQQELKLNPLDSEANAELGGIYVLQHDLDKGMPLLKLAVKTNPDLLKARRDLGEAYYLNGRYEDAERELKVALPADHDGSIYGLLANVYKKLGRPVEAQKAFEESIKMKAAVAGETPRKLKSWAK